MLHFHAISWFYLGKDLGIGRHLYINRSIKSLEAYQIWLLEEARSGSEGPSACLAATPSFPDPGLPLMRSKQPHFGDLVHASWTQGVGMCGT